MESGAIAKMKALEGAGTAERWGGSLQAVPGEVLCEWGTDWRPTQGQGEMIGCFGYCTLSVCTCYGKHSV